MAPALMNLANDRSSRRNPPTEPFPRPRRLCFHPNEELSARVRGAVKVVLRRSGEGYAEALARHQQGGPEDCGTSSEFFSHNTLWNADQQINLRRQDVVVVARHMAGEGPLRNLEKFFPRVEGDGPQMTR